MAPPRGEGKKPAPRPPKEDEDLYSSTAIDESGRMIQELLAEGTPTSPAQQGLWDLGSADTGLDRQPEQSSVATLWERPSDEVNDNDATAANINAEEVLRAAMAHRVNKPESPTPPAAPWKDLDDSHQTIDGGESGLSLPSLSWPQSERTEQWQENTPLAPPQPAAPTARAPQPLAQPASEARRSGANRAVPRRETAKLDKDTAPSIAAYKSAGAIPVSRESTQLDERIAPSPTATDAPGLKLSLPEPGSLVPTAQSAQALGSRPQAASSPSAPAPKPVQGPLKFVVPAAPSPPPAPAPPPATPARRSVGGSTPSVPASLPPGATVFGRYVLLERVGVGGMADVRLGCQTGARGFTKPCVIKRISEGFLNDRAFREMFVEEAKACSLLAHPNIVRLLEFDEVDGVPYLALELVDGVNLHSLDALSGEEGLPLSVILDVGIETSAALHHAHEAVGPNGPLNMIHRDISPQNILISRNGEVKLADFGIARFEGRMHHTAFGPPKGKLRYMAPEQLRFEKLDRRTDIFSLGVCLVEMITGRALMPEGVIVAEDPPAIVRDRLARRAPQQLIELLARTVAISIDDRIPTAAELREGLVEARQMIERPESIADYAMRVIAPAVPSAESAIFALLGDNSSARSAPDAPRPQPNPASKGRRPLDLSESLLDEEGAGAFPTTALFVLRAPIKSPPPKADTASLKARPAIGGASPVVPQEESLDATHQSDEPGVPESLREFLQPSAPAPMNDRPGSGFGPTLIRPDGSNIKEMLQASAPKPSTNPPPGAQGAQANFKADPSFRKGVLKELGPKKSDPAPTQQGSGLVAPPIPTQPAPRTSSLPPAPHPQSAPTLASPPPVSARRARNRAIAIVAAIWLAAMAIGLLAFLTKKG